MGEIALTSEAAVAHASVFELANDAAQAFSELHFAARSTLWKLAWFKQPDESEIEVAIEAARRIRGLEAPLADAVDHQRSELRRCSTGVTNFYGCKGASGPEAVLEATSSVSKLADHLPRIVDAMKHTGRVRRAIAAWKLLSTFNRGSAWWSDTVQCLDIEAARFEERNSDSTEDINRHVLIPQGVEKRIIAVVWEHGPLIGKKIAARVGRPFNGGFRRTLALLVRTRYLAQVPPDGYRALECPTMSNTTTS